MRFKEIVGFEDYLIYENGNVFSKKSNKFLRPRKRGSRRPYHVVALYDGLGNAKNVSIHRLVAEAFIPNPDNKPVVNHKDNNPFNNDVGNLEWATDSENVIHGYNETDRNRGFKGVLQIDKKTKEVIAEFNSVGEAGKAIGIHYTNISKVLNGNGKTAGGYIWKYKED